MSVFILCDGDKQGNCTPTFRIQGQSCHVVNSVLPKTHLKLKFLEIYLMWNGKSKKRLYGPTPKEKFCTYDLQELLHGVNPYVQNFKKYI